MDAVSRKMIAPANCWSFDRASASSRRAPASVSVRISATMGSSLKIRFRSKPSELMIGPKRVARRVAPQQLTPIEARAPARP